MPTQKSLIPRLTVDVKCTYVAAESKPEEGYFFFAYKITIKNSGQSTAQLINRHWVITDALGRVEEVRGPGVVGQQPHIQAGQSFDYESACPLGTSSGSMKGSYEMVDENGENFDLKIPEFFLIAPQALH